MIPGVVYIHRVFDLYGSVRFLLINNRVGVITRLEYCPDTLTLNIAESFYDMTRDPLFVIENFK